MSVSTSSSTRCCSSTKSHYPLPSLAHRHSARHSRHAGVYDAHGHSLSTLDLQRHLFRVPCSFMIHSPIFQALPAAARQAVYARMSEILSDLDGPRTRRRMALAERDAVIHLLRETVRDLPAGFGQASHES